MVIIKVKLKKNLKISIIIPTMDRSGSLEKALISLEDQTYTNFEVVIVDGSTDNLTKIVADKYKKTMSITFLKQKTKGLVNVINEGVDQATGDVLIRTDDDIIADKEWLEEIINAFNMAESVGGVTGPTIIPDEIEDSRDLFYFQKKMKSGNFFWRLLGKFYFKYLLEDKAFAVGKFFRSGAFSVGSNYIEYLTFDKCIEVDHLEGCNLAVRNDLLKRIGGFDPIFSGVAEYNDADAAYKIRKLGYKILFNPKAKMLHLPSKDGAYKERINSYSRMINFLIFYFRHIKPNNLDKFLRFSSYLFFLNGYYTYRFFTTRNFGYLQSIPATFIGFFQNVFRRN